MVAGVYKLRNNYVYYLINVKHFLIIYSLLDI